MDNLTKEFEEILFPIDGALNSAPLLSQWKQAKSEFIKAFGGKTYFRYGPIEIHLSSQEKEARFQDFLTELEAREALNPSLKSFLKDNENSFFENRVTKPYPNIPAGAKLSKALKNFVPNYRLEWVQDMASRYMQEDKIKGYLYLSVDPRDFLTLSENGEGWRSCHALDGDYRAGNLSYMVDSTTFVAYLADENKKHFDCLPDDMKWFSKRWRMLVHMDNVIYFNKQYPYNCRELLLKTYEILLKFFPGDWMEPREYGFRYYKDSSGNTDSLPANQLVDWTSGYVHNSRSIIDFDDYLGFPDLVSSPSYVPIASLSRSRCSNYRTISFDYPPNEEEETKAFKKLFGIKIGGTPICPSCGRADVTQPYSMFCEECAFDVEDEGSYYGEK